MVGLNVTHLTMMDQDYLRSLEAIGNKAGKLIGEITKFYLAANGGVTMPTHDPSAIMYYVEPQLFTSKPVHLYIQTEVDFLL